MSDFYRFLRIKLKYVNEMLAQRNDSVVIGILEVERKAILEYLGDQIEEETQEVR